MAQLDHNLLVEQAQDYVRGCLSASERDIRIISDENAIVKGSKVQARVIDWFDLVVKHTIAQCIILERDVKDILKRSRLLENPNSRPKTIDINNISQVCCHNAGGVNFQFTSQEILNPNQNKLLKGAMDSADGKKSEVSNKAKINFSNLR